MNGNVVWKKAYDSRYSSAYNAITATDDGVIVAGMVWNDALIVKYDMAGNVVWKKTFGGSGVDGFNAVTTSTDGFLAVGASFSNDLDLDHLNHEGEDALMVQYDRDGNVVWKKTIGGTTYDVFNDVTANEQGVLAVGSASYKDYAIILDLRPLNQIQQITLDYSASFRFVTINPADASETFNWTSSDTSIIPLYYGGVVGVTDNGSAVLEGTSTKNNEDKIRIPIQVNEYVKVTISPEETLYLTTGTSSKLTTLVTPVDATNQHINWTSSDPSIATVDSNGNVTAIRRGKVAVTATSEVGGYKAKVLVIVSLPYHKVSFNSNGGTFVSDRYYEEGSLIDRLEIPLPTKAGYVFGGWYKDENLTNPWYETSDRVESDTTLYAKWNIRSYRVDFYPTNGSQTNTIFVYENKLIPEPTTPKRTGYTFGGWYKEDGKTQWHFSTDKITTGTMLFAKWTLNSYTVNFNSMGGSAVSAITANHNTTVTTPLAPKRTGYTFVGWTKDSSGKTPWIFVSDKVTSNTTLYAKWRINQYTVNFNSNGGSKVSAKTTNYNTTVTAPTVPKRTGYTFGGWYKESSLKTPWRFSSDKVTKNTTLYAKWTVTPPATPKSITVTKSSLTSLKITWSKASGASGYELYRATKSSGSYTLIKSTTSVQVTNSNLKRGSTYYYKVRAYKLVGTKKVYSGWSVIRSAKL
ncbi:InlB B-repeat-containing protein [Bacillus sp. AFS001701]|uniref:InlB B-repeat-containing protein n=1 Tax=Bacillus sp. AFS001701 TaxID=2033480 RepID=UPI001596698F|nr:InlB B-repeat-containing protein [Bacillus sp. AFS001701]